MNPLSMLNNTETILDARWEVADSICRPFLGTEVAAKSSGRRQQAGFSAT
jgi:hypothetical protein